MLPQLLQRRPRFQSQLLHPFLIRIPILLAMVSEWLVAQLVELESESELVLVLVLVLVLELVLESASGLVSEWVLVSVSALVSVLALDPAQGSGRLGLSAP
jgi:hypothetical protein